MLLGETKMVKELEWARFKQTYDLPKEVEALQSAIEIYAMNDETLEVGETLTKLLIERTEHALTHFKEFLYSIQNKIKEDC